MNDDLLYAEQTIREVSRTKYERPTNIELSKASFSLALCMTRTRPPQNVTFRRCSAEVGGPG